MKATRLRNWADINPDTPEFVGLRDDEAVTFMPLETVWADPRVDLRRLRPKVEVQVGYVRFRRGDVLLPKVTPTFQAARTAWVHDLPTVVGAGSTELHVLRARPDADARMIAYATRTKHFVEEGITAFQGVAGLQRVPEIFVANFSVPDWPLEDQRRIADFLDDQVAVLDRAIALRQRQVTLSRERFDAEIERRIVPYVDCSRKLIHVLAVLRDGTHTPPPRVDHGVPLLTAKNVRGHRFQFTGADTMIATEAADELDRGLKARAGDVLLSIKGSVGNAALVPIDAPRFTFERNLALLRAKSGVLEPKWLYYSIRSRIVQDQIRLGMTFSAQPGIYLGSLGVMRVPVPPLDQQLEGVRALVDGEVSLARLETLCGQSLALLQERRQALITAAVTGAFDVTTARMVSVDV